MTFSNNMKPNPQESFPIMTLVATGLIFAIVGFFLCSAYPKGSDINFAGFGIMIIGIATFILGTFGTIAAAVKNRLDQNTFASAGNGNKPLILTIWLSGLGLVLFVTGFLLGSNFSAKTALNYYGFYVLLAGICVFIFGVFGSISAAIKTNLEQKEAHSSAVVEKPRFLLNSILIVGVGIVLAVTGYILRDTFSGDISMTYAGFGMLVAGMVMFIIGVFSTVTLTIAKKLGLEKGSSELTSKRLFLSLWTTCSGIIFTAVGLYLKLYPINLMASLVGFGLLVMGVAVLILGATGSVALILKKRQSKNESWSLINNRPRAFFASVMSTGSGIALLAVGFILSSSYSKATLLNYTGFIMLLIGVGITVFSAFELTRLYATCYLHNKSCSPSEPKKAGKIRTALKNRWAYYFSARAVFNIAGIMTAIGLLFFSLWQLDLIVSGPVWYESGGRGWSWSKSGAYADAPFQCFLWKTTVGQAYDTLFMLVFISFVILFISAFFWPRTNPKNETPR